jgi:hypothetical protein
MLYFYQGIQNGHWSVEKLIHAVQLTHCACLGIRINSETFSKVKSPNYDTRVKIKILTSNNERSESAV